MVLHCPAKQLISVSLVFVPLDPEGTLVPVAQEG